MPRFTASKILRALLRGGFYVHHQTGSHINLRHKAKPHLHVVIARHGGDIAPKTVKSIIVQAELTIKEFRKLL
ncbi:type II toxin-antitoxin system HicA family toxin [Candidatus Wolfebacteria bacterium]|nr:type II toxin-antitoxin system HicA family toxin [Candidatus Wolfebacteria bacterium]